METKKCWCHCHDRKDYVSTDQRSTTKKIQVKTNVPLKSSENEEAQRSTKRKIDDDHSDSPPLKKRHVMEEEEEEAMDYEFTDDCMDYDFLELKKNPCK